MQPDLVTFVSVVLPAITAFAVHKRPTHAAFIAAAGVLATQWLLPDHPHQFWAAWLPAPRLFAVALLACLLIGLRIWNRKTLPLTTTKPLNRRIRQEHDTPQQTFQSPRVGGSFSKLLPKIGLSIMDAAMLAFVFFPAALFAFRDYSSAAWFHHVVRWLPAYVVGRWLLTNGPPLAVPFALVATALLLVPLTLFELVTGHPVILIALDCAPPRLNSAPMLLNILGPEVYRPQLGGGPIGVVFRFASAVAVIAVLASASQVWTRQHHTVLLISAVVLLAITLCSNVVFAGLTAVLATTIGVTAGKLCLRSPRVAFAIAFLPLLSAAGYLTVRLTGVLSAQTLAPAPHLNQGLAGYFNKTRSLWHRLSQEEEVVRQASFLGGSPLDPSLHTIDGYWVQLVLDAGWFGLTLWALVLLTGGMTLLRSAGPLSNPLRNEQPRRLFGLCGLGVLGVYAICSLANHPSTVLISLFLGAAASQSRHHRSRSAPLS